MNDKTMNLMRKIKNLSLLDRVLIACVLVISSPSANAECNGLSCLVCEQLADDEHYTEGVMKAMKHITPGHGTWLFRSEYDLSNEFGLPKAFRSDFKRLVSEFNRRGTEVVFVVQPTRGMMHRDKVLEDKRYGFEFSDARENLAGFLKQLRDGGAVVPDVLPLVDNPSENEYFFRRDHHWTPDGAKKTAQIVAASIKSLPAYQDIEPKSYVTEKGTVIPKDGTMNRSLRHICGNNYGMQYVQGYQTVPADSDEDALFGDPADPEVVLVGTSNSAERDDDYKNYNFSGFLKQALEVDILNYALPGAGQEGALLQYLLSDDYLIENPPKILIWELPASYHLDDEKIYRQLIPAIKGGCDASQQVVLSKEHALPALAKEQRMEILSNTGSTQKQLVNFKGFLELEFSDKNIKDFYVITYFDNGARDKVWFRRTGIVDGGKFYLEVSQDKRFKNANLMSIFIESSEPVEKASTLKAGLCI